jgi:glutamyl-tRNA reductase
LHFVGVEVREKVAIPETEWRAIAAEIVRECPSIAEASVLSTCNRFEIYLAASNTHSAINEIIDYLVVRAAKKQASVVPADAAVDNIAEPVTKEMLTNHLFLLNGDDVIWHLLRVAAGLDSLVIGEGQILAQVKKSYEFCSLNLDTEAKNEEDKNGQTIAKNIEVSKNLVSGKNKNAKNGEAPPAGKLLSKLLNTAVAAGKRARSETDIAKGAVSISSAAAQFTSEKVASDCQIRNIQDANICIIGTGEMARLLLVHLKAEGVRTVTMVNRSPNRIEELRTAFPDMNIKFELLNEKLWDVIADSDVVYPSTASKVAIITPEPLMKALERRKRPGGLLLVDISVPRNVHPGCSQIPGVVSYNVDVLKAAVDRNTAKRQKEIIEVESLLKTELERFSIWKNSLNAVPTITKLQEFAEEIRVAELNKLSPALAKKLDANDLKLVEKLSRGIVSKLLHGPMAMLRNLNSNNNHNVADSVQDDKNALNAIKNIRQAFLLD